MASEDRAVSKLNAPFPEYFVVTECASKPLPCFSCHGRDVTSNLGVLGCLVHCLVCLRNAVTPSETDTSLKKLLRGERRRTILPRCRVQRVARHSSSKVDVNVKQLIGLSGSEGRFFSGPFQMAISFHKWEAIKLNASNVAAEHGQKTGEWKPYRGGRLSSPGKSDFIVLFGVNGWGEATASIPPHLS